MKKTICLVTDWYPSKENPFRGLFFKEQAFSVSDYFDFVVVRTNFHPRNRLIYKNSQVNRTIEKNTIEYTFDLAVPLSVYFSDVISDNLMKFLNKGKVDGVGKYVSKSYIRYFKKNIVKFFNKNIKEDIDVFYCVDAQEEAFLIQCLAEAYNKPYIVSEHAPFPWPGKVIRDVDKYAIEKADMYLAISNDKIRQLLLQNIKLPETRYIGNLIDESQLLINRNYNDIKTFIIVAAHSFYKNYDHFICVMNRLTEITDCPFKVMIVGYGSNKGYSKNIDEFEDQIRTSKFADRAIMIPSVPHEEIGAVLNKADAFIMTSIQEGQPVSAMEAACCGLPIFSTRCGGVEDYVDENMGRIYSVCDSESMAQDLKDFLEGNLSFDPIYIRNRVVSRFGNERFVYNFSHAFHSVIEKTESNV